MAEAPAMTDVRPTAATPDRAGGSDAERGAVPHPARGNEHPATTGGEPADSGRTLVKVTVNLTPRAVEALDQACARTKDSKTDTINRALVVYQIVLELMDRGGGQLMFQDREGRTERIHLL